MNNSKKVKKALQKRIDTFNGFSDYVSTMNKVVPYVKKLKERTEWELETIETLPIKLQSNIDNSFVDSVCATTAYIDRNLPTQHAINVNSLSAIVTADSTAVHSLLQIDSGDPEISNWSINTAQKYKGIQKQQQVETEVSNKLKIFNKKIGEEYSNSLNEFIKSIELKSILPNIANNFRNVLYKFRGELWDRVKKPSEQKLSWKIISDRIPLEVEGSFERTKLNEMEQIYKNLHDSLSRLCKDRLKIEQGSIDNIKSEYIDYLYTILHLVKISDKP